MKIDKGVTSDLDLGMSLAEHPDLSHKLRDMLCAPGGMDRAIQILKSEMPKPPKNPLEFHVPELIGKEVFSLLDDGLCNVKTEGDFGPYGTESVRRTLCLDSAYSPLSSSESNYMVEVVQADKPVLYNRIAEEMGAMKRVIFTEKSNTTVVSQNRHIESVTVTLGFLWWIARTKNVPYGKYVHIQFNAPMWSHEIGDKDFLITPVFEKRFLRSNRLYYHYLGHVFPKGTYFVCLKPVEKKDKKNEVTAT